MHRALANLDTYFRSGLAPSKAGWLRTSNNKGLQLFGRMWLPIYLGPGCNRDPRSFRNPLSFDPVNIREARQRDGMDSDALQFLYRGDELTSFGGGSMQSPGGDLPGGTRRCPGRIYTVVLQRAILTALYRDFDVVLERSKGREVTTQTLITQPIVEATVRLEPRPASIGSPAPAVDDLR